MQTLNPLDLSISLMRCPSVTPIDAGALGVLVEALEPLGFVCKTVNFSQEGTEPVNNLYARFGTEGKNLCFAGHTDVVPVGDRTAWRIDPFQPEVINNVLYGRGAVDMKAAICCFAAAASEFIQENKNFAGSISFLITGDEEGPAINGTDKMLKYLHAQGETIDACVVGEPTNPSTLGEMVKIGRRGSISFELVVHGTQGHVAYPHLADNPITSLIKILATLKNHVLDEGTPFFPPSNLEVTTVDVNNPAGNVIPAKATAYFNIRFNDLHCSKTLHSWVEEVCRQSGARYELRTVSGIAEAFLTPKGHLSDITCAAIEEVTAISPEVSTTGGTSDARFIKNYCPVVEFGLINQTAHKVDECIGVDDIFTLTKIYKRMIEKYFAANI